MDFIERLKVLSEIENCLNSIWSNNAANGADNLNLANVILRLEELVKTLENVKNFKFLKILLIKYLGK